MKLKIINVAQIFVHVIFAVLESQLSTEAEYWRQNGTVDQRLGPETDAHANRVLAARILLKRPSVSRTPNVSAAHAIFHEAAQEERQALRRKKL